MRPLLLALAIVLSALPVAAQYEVTLAADVNTNTTGSNGNGFAVYDGRLFFAANDGESGSELWALDTATGEPSLVADLYPGVSKSGSPNSSAPSDFAVYDGHLFFAAQSGLGPGRELWTYDADTGEVALADDGEPGPYDPSGFTVYDGRLFFAAERGPIRRELWVYDAATGTTSLVADIDPSGDSAPSYLTVYDDRLFFTATTLSDGGRLRVYDAATDEVRRVTDAVLNPTYLTIYDDRLFFSAFSGQVGVELWSYDAATGGVTLVEDIYPGGSPFGGSNSSSPADLIVYDGLLTFGATDGEHRGVWTYDAATDNVTFAAEAEVALIVPLGFGPSFTRYDDRLFFQAFDDETGSELWVYDAAIGEATLAADIYPGRGVNIPNSSRPSYFTVFDGQLFFQAEDGEHGQEVWRFDAATEDAALVADIDTRTLSSFPSGLTVYDDRLFFGAFTEQLGGELRTYDPVTGEATLAADIYPGSGGFFPRELTVYDGRLFFNADDGESGNELWAYDATTGEAVLVADIRPGSFPLSSNPSDLTVYDDRLFFGADGDETGSELWVHDAATGETTPAADLVPGLQGSGPSSLTVYDGRLFFSAFSGERYELWAYDAATGETTSIFGIGPNSGNFEELTVYDGHLFFSARSANQRELWVYDAATGEAVPAITQGPNPSSPASLTVYDDRLFFRAFMNGTELWVYDAATGEANLAAAIDPGDLVPDHFEVFNGRLFFQANDAENMSLRRLWVYDAGTGEAMIVTDEVLLNGSSLSPSENFVVYDGRLFFPASTSQVGGELWVLTSTTTAGEPDLAPRPMPLHAPYPNPARRDVTLTFEVADIGPIHLAVFDVLGRRVGALADGPVAAGEHTVRWDAGALPSGVYLVRLTAGDTVQTQRLTLAR